jgi:hypothetical protein
MTDETLLQSFEDGVDPPGGFHHREHVRVAWCYLRRHPLPHALERFRAGLRRFAAVHGAAERYHETITTAYVLLIHKRLERTQGAGTWAQFEAANPDLLSWNPSILDRYYPPGTLSSDEARRSFVRPPSGGFE